jgi:hypothetical protein
MTTTTAIGAIRELTREVRLDLTAADEAVLSQQVAMPLTAAQDARVHEIADAFQRGFFFSGAKGHVFADPSDIAQHFGLTLERNYPEASPAFLRFAYTYWTLKIIVSSKMKVGDTLAWNLLAAYESQILRPLFFPTFGPSVVPPDQREAAQRLMIAKSGAPVDLDEFMRGNPILIRDRLRSKPSGCALVVIAFVAIVVTMALI